MSAKMLEPVLTLEESSLPASWRLASIPNLIGEDGVFVDGDWVESKDQNPNGDVRLIQLADVGDGSYRNKSARFLTTTKSKELRCHFLKKGDVLIARMPDPLGRACIFPGDSKESVTVVDVAFIRAGNDEFSHKWLMYFVNAPAFRAAVAALQSGTTRKRISRRNLSRIQLPVPPRDQQDRIVAEIEKLFSRLDKAIASLKRVKANLKRYKAAVLKAAVEGKLTEEWRKQNPDIEPASKLLERILAERRMKWEEAELAKMKAKGKELKDDKWKKKYKEIESVPEEGLPEIPDSWVWAKLPQVGELNRGKSKHRPRNDPVLYDGPYPFVQTGDIRKAAGTLTEYSQTYSKQGLSQSRLWQPGTLCITIAANIADTAILGFEACFPDSIVGFVPDSPDLDVRFYEYFIRTAKENLDRFAPATAQKNINLGILSEVAVPFPPAKEQDAIVGEIESRLSVAQSIEAAIEIEVARALRLKQSILRAAFSEGLVENHFVSCL